MLLLLVLLLLMSLVVEFREDLDFTARRFNKPADIHSTVVALQGSNLLPLASMINSHSPYSKADHSRLPAIVGPSELPRQQSPNYHQRK